MSKSYLQLNSDKTEVIIFGPPKSISTVVDKLALITLHVKSHARNLGVILDLGLCRMLRMISHLKSFLSSNDLEKLIDAVITSRLDYCTSLDLGLPLSS